MPEIGRSMSLSVEPSQSPKMLRGAESNRIPGTIPVYLLENGDRAEAVY